MTRRRTGAPAPGAATEAAVAAAVVFLEAELGRHTVVVVRIDGELRVACTCGWPGILMKEAVEGERPPGFLRHVAVAILRALATSR